MSDSARVVPSAVLTSCVEPKSFRLVSSSGSALHVGGDPSQEREYTRQKHSNVRVASIALGSGAGC
jgi:hypothetical protein